MKKVFIDTNVLIDFLGERETFYHSAALIASRADRKEIELMVSSLSYATASYILSRYNPAEIVIDKMRKFATLCTITSIGADTVTKALYSPFKDFEDALQFNSALEAGAEIIITRNKKDFILSSLPVLTPTEYLDT